MPTYDGGDYCVEHMELGLWKKKKTGIYLARNWNHITLAYALTQYEHLTRLGNAARIVHEPSNKRITENSVLFHTVAAGAWGELLRTHIDGIRALEQIR